MTWDAEVAVVGLGALGSSAAWQLATRGVDVIGIEQFEPGHDQGGSHGVTRLFRVACLEHPTLAPIARRARTLWRELEAMSGQPLLRETGGLMIGEPDSRIISGTLLAATTHGVAVERLDRAEIARRFPAHARVDEGQIGVWDPEAGVLRPEAAIRAAVDAARAAGAQVVTGSMVLAIEPDDDGVTVRTSDVTYRVARVAVTAGPWIDRFVPLPLVPNRQVLTWFRARAGERADLDALPVFIRRVPGHATWIWGHGAVPGEFDVKVGPEFDGPMVRVDPDAVDRVVHPGETDEVRDLVAATFPALEPEPSAATTCIMTHTPDMQFVVGPTGHPRVTVGGGCSGHSFKHAAALGELVAQHTLGEARLVDDGFMDPRRFG